MSASNLERARAWMNDHSPWQEEDVRSLAHLLAAVEAEAQRAMRAKADLVIYNKLREPHESYYVALQEVLIEVRALEVGQ